MPAMRRFVPQWGTKGLVSPRARLTWGRRAAEMSHHSNISTVAQRASERNRFWTRLGII